MSKSSTPSDNLEFSDDWSSHPAVEWVLNHKSIFIWGFITLLLFLIAGSRFASMRTLKAEGDFFQAQTAFSQFQKESFASDNTLATSELDQLEGIMQRHPEIQPKYQGALAQTLLISGNVPQAQKFANDIFKRTKPDSLQHYHDYSKASLLIAAGSISEALTQAQQLKSALEQAGEEANPTLYIFNLIRLAMLYQQTNQPREELKTWEELQHQSATRLDAVVAANKALKIGQSSLNQYIDQRKKLLTH